MSYQHTLNSKMLAVIALFLVLTLTFANSSFAFLAYAQEVPPEETQQTETVEEQTVVEEPTPDSNDNPGDEGTDGTDGTPQEETTPAEDGEDGAPNEGGGDGGTGNNGTSTNEAPEPDGEPAIIDTGDATSTATGVTGANLNDIDTNASSTSTSTPQQGSGDTNVNLGNNLSASTTATSTSNTGENSGGDPDGIGIFTGDGVSSVFDILAFNVALVNSTGEILLLKNPLADELDLRERIMDIFEDLTGSPGTCTLLACKTADAMFNYAGDNVGNVERSTASLCNSGYNEGTASEGQAYIDTGNCLASNLTVTIGNLTAVQSRYLIILMNHLGDLSGNIILPEASFFEALRGGASLGEGSDLIASSTADIGNFGTSTASSGSNTAIGDTFSGIESGDADTHAFVGNYANQINPPTCFIISVGGEWTGDVYQIPEGYDREHTPYADVICGRGGGESGQAPQNLNATTTNFAKLLVKAIAQATTGNNTAVGAQATIKSGNAESFLFILNILNTTLINQDWLFGLFTVSGDWDGSFYFGAPPNPTPTEQAAGAIVTGTSKSTTNKKSSAPASGVVLTKVSSSATLAAPGSVEYTITLKNQGGKLYGALLEDVMTNPAGIKIHEEKWDLGTVLADEEIVVKYTMQFNAGLPPGEYVNAVRFTGHLYKATGPEVKPVYTSSSVKLLGEVLGLGDCPAYLSHYISPAGGNDPEQVRLLEVFLRDGRGESIVPDGIYDGASIEAVKDFQREYAEDILSPWGIGFATGHVYYTTERKINELYCQGQKDFALTQGQLAEIDYYREFVLGQGPIAPDLVGTPPPSISETFDSMPDLSTTRPLLYPLRWKVNSYSLLETLMGWMSTFTSIQVAEAAQF